MHALPDSKALHSARAIVRQQIDELTRQRQESEDSIRRRFGTGLTGLAAAAEPPAEELET